MKPVRSLSKTWKPRQYSSGSPGSRKPPGRLSTLEKDSKSTENVNLCVREGERRAHTVTANGLFEVSNLGEGGVLAAGAEEVAEGVEGDAAVAAFVE
jgi:hypothetical protein